MATAIFANAAMHAHAQVSQAYSAQHDEHDEPHTLERRRERGGGEEKEEDNITGIQVIVGAGRGMLIIIIILLESIELFVCLDLLVNI
jgi:hypothetical protein